MSSSGLSMHILDTASGSPAAGVPVTLTRLHPDGRREVLLRATTNADGRTEGALLAGDAFQPGRYELLLEMAGYFRAKGFALTEPPFLDQIPVCFAVADGAAHYHVPLLVSPYGYSTYRGS